MSPEMNHYVHHTEGVYTAVQLPSNDHDLEQPLLAPSKNQNNNNSDDDAALDKKTDPLLSLRMEFLKHGAVIGFLAQLVNVFGTTVLYSQWGSSSKEQSLSNILSGFTTTSTVIDSTCHLLVWILSRVDLYLYIGMWVALTLILTKPGMNYVQDRFFVTSASSSLAGAEEDDKMTKRSIFVLGVQFYVGVVIGVFLAWTGIDFYLGLPIPLISMFGVLVFGLVISYTMIWCYDLEDHDE